MFLDDHLSPRDQDIVTSVGTFTQLTGPQVERLHFNDGSKASRTGRRNRTLRRLVKWKAIGVIQERAIGGWKTGSQGYVYVPVDSDRQLRDTHTLNIAELYIMLTEAAGIEVLEYRPEAQVEGMSIKPDAQVRLRLKGRRLRLYVEVEYSRKDDERVREKLRSYERAARGQASFPLVLYLTANQQRLNAIQRVIDKSAMPEIFQVALFDEVIQFLEG